jgi:hypothetical protein
MKQWFWTVLFVVSLQTGWGHALWMEPGSEGKSQICFGEADNNLREPFEKIAKLGEIRADAATPAGFKPVALEKSAQAWVLRDAPAGVSLVFRAENIPVREPKTAGAETARSQWYGRFVGSEWRAAEAMLPIDIVPAGPNTVQVFFKKQPLAKTTLKILFAGGKGEVVTDEQGKAALPAAKAGLVLVTAQAKDAAPGEFGGKAYQALSYRIVFSFIAK